MMILLVVIRMQLAAHETETAPERTGISFFFILLDLSFEAMLTTMGRRGNDKRLIRPSWLWPCAWWSSGGNGMPSAFTLSLKGAGLLHCRG